MNVNLKDRIMKEILVYLILVILIICTSLYLQKLFADSVSDYEVISPRDGVQCIIVNRSFNTSVDCWIVGGEGILPGGEE